MSLTTKLCGHGAKERTAHGGDYVNFKNCVIGYCFRHIFIRYRHTRHKVRYVCTSYRSTQLHNHENVTCMILQMFMLDAKIFKHVKLSAPKHRPGRPSWSRRLHAGDDLVIARLAVHHVRRDDLDHGLCLYLHFPVFVVVLVAWRKQLLLGLM
jgi:hypothetical protein